MTRPAVADLPDLADHIRDLRIAGLSLHEIARRLNADGIPTMRGGKRWRASAVQTITGYRRPLDGKGISNTPTYISWRAMLWRITPEAASYDYYGARGVTVCERWREFEPFLEDMGERPLGTTLDRIDPDGNYEPGNCRWATPLQQAHNQRHNEHEGVLEEWTARSSLI